MLPTFAGYNNIWCGGGDVVVPDTYIYPYYYGNDGGGLVFGLGVNYSIDSLTFYSSACSFQGKNNQVKIAVSELLHVLGAIILFGFLSCTFWWVIIAFNLCLEVKPLSSLNLFLESP